MPVGIHRVLVIAIAPLLAAACNGREAPARTAVPAHDVRLYAGDHPMGADPLLNDTGWDQVDLTRLPQQQGVFWIRSRVVVLERPAAYRPLGVRFSLLGAREIFWDGRLIGRSGIVGNSRTTERPGAIDEPLVIPGELSDAGSHVLAVRFSNFHYDLGLANYFQGLEVAEYQSLLEAPLRAGTLMLLPLAGLVIVAVYYGALFIVAGRRPSYVWFSLLSVAIGVLLAAEAWRWVIGYTYDRHVMRLTIQAGAAGLIGVLLPVSMLFEFALRHRTRWIVAAVLLVAAAVVVPDGFDAKSTYAITAGLIVAVLIVLVAAMRRQPGSIAASAGLVPCLVLLWWTPPGFGELWYFVGFSSLAAGTLVALTRRMREEQRRASLASLRSAQLELQLLKTSLQPHFIMNTLTSMLEWVEVDPAQASRFIEALADELRLLADVSARRLIPVGLELQLCRSHLAIMSLRHEKTFNLRTDGSFDGDTVPPAIFHTLIENGLTHGTFTSDCVEFLLERTGAERVRQYRLVSPESAAATVEPKSEGTGLRYVRARLEESYPGRWTLTARSLPDGWETVIRIRDEAGAGGVAV